MLPSDVSDMFDHINHLGLSKSYHFDSIGRPRITLTIFTVLSTKGSLRLQLYSICISTVINREEME